MRRIRAKMQGSGNIAGYEVYDDETNKVEETFSTRAEAEKYVDKDDPNAAQKQLKHDLEADKYAKSQGFGKSNKTAEAITDKVYGEQGKKDIATAKEAWGDADKKEFERLNKLDNAKLAKEYSKVQPNSPIGQIIRQIQEARNSNKEITYDDITTKTKSASTGEWTETNNPENRPTPRVENTASYKLNQDISQQQDGIVEDKPAEKASTPAEKASNNEQLNLNQVDSTDEQIAKENPEAVTEELEENPEKLNKLFEAYKSGKLDLYPTLKAIVDTVSKNARMNMDRAALLTGGERDLDAYNPIEVEHDKIREQQIEDRAKIGSSLPEAFEAAENGDNTLLLRAMDAGEITNASEEEKLKIVTAIQEQIHSIDDRITQLNEIKRSLAGHDWEAFSKAGTAYRSVIEGIKTKSTSSGGSTTQGGNLGGNLSFMGIGIQGGGTDMSTGQSSTGFNEDLNLSGRITDLLNKGQEAMESQDEANNQMIAQIDKQIANLQNEKQYWQSLMKKNRLTRLNYKTGDVNANTNQ